ncbi:hypothetical protein FQR65_LT20680 [Abscondita terminalis]|nr:hypothetical protein FQR65_LT20680 [Abscondita terminalis]
MNFAHSSKRVRKSCVSSWKKLAGVSKYKERRRETENRLQDTRENLLRVEDILRELNTNLEKLQSQAAVAQKFHELQADQDEKQKLLWLLRKNEAKNEQEKFFRDIEKAQTDLEEQDRQLRHVETELEHMRHGRITGCGDRMHQAQGHLTTEDHRVAQQDHQRNSNRAGVRHNQRNGVEYFVLACQYSRTFCNKEKQGLNLPDTTHLANLKMQTGREAGHAGRSERATRKSRRAIAKLEEERRAAQEQVNTGNCE